MNIRTYIEVNNSKYEIATIGYKSMLHGEFELVKDVDIIRDSMATLVQVGRKGEQIESSILIMGKSSTGEKLYNFVYTR